MRKVSIFVCLMALVLCWGGVASAHQTLGAHIKCQDSFVFMLDYSGSMMMTHKLYKEEKLDVAKQAMAKINAKLPNLAYQAAVNTFNPNRAVVAAGAWNRADLNKAIWGIRSGQNIFGRMTPMARGLASTPVLPGKTAVILFSDGDNNLGSDPVASANAIYAANPGATIHVVSLADTPKGAAVLKGIAGLKAGSVLVDATELVAVDELADKFVKDVFCYEAILPQDFVTLRSVHFAIGSYKLDKVATATLDAYATVLKTRPAEKLNIVGWADVTGNKQSNLVLSQNRAKAVRAYLENAGVKNPIFVEEGRGVSYYFDNNNTFGRFMNRRVEVNIVNP